MLLPCLCKPRDSLDYGSTCAPRHAPGIREWNRVENFVAQVLASATVSTALSAILVWLTKTWISGRLRGSIKSESDQRLEAHKAQRKAQSDIEIEKLRSQLSISATEHQVRFANLHEKRAEVITTTYSLLRTYSITFEITSKYMKRTGINRKSKGAN
jgi:short subunit dehydrogenase-like uncharacterized protein